MSFDILNNVRIIPVSLRIFIWARLLKLSKLSCPVFLATSRIVIIVIMSVRCHNLLSTKLKIPLRYFHLMILLILFVRFMDPIIHHQIRRMKNVSYATVVDTNLSTVLNILITIYVNDYRSQIQRCRQRYFPSINIRPVFVGLPLHLLKFPSLRMVIFGTSPSTNKTTTSTSILLVVLRITILMTLHLPL